LKPKTRGGGGGGGGLGGVKSMEGDIGTRNTILNQFSDTWTMYWYLFTLETFWVINLGFFWMCDVAIKSLSKICSPKINTKHTHVSFQTLI
jgi:hypothetical protein